jgi:hypothetical protein
MDEFRDARLSSGHIDEHFHPEISNVLAKYGLRASDDEV